MLYPLPRVSQGGFNEENGDWCLVLVDKSRKEARYFEARRAADFKCLKFKSAADMCVVLTHKLRKQKNKVIRKKDMKGYRHFHNQIGEHPLQQIHSFRVSANGLFVCKVVEWICTKGNPRTETYQEDILNYGKVIQRVVVEVCLNKKIQW